MTNISGKFVTPTSHAAIGADAADFEKDPSIIPPVPSNNGNNNIAGQDYMAMLRRYFGQLWWLWLVVIFVWLNKK